MRNIGNPFVECTSRDMSFEDVFNYWCDPFSCYSIDYQVLKRSVTPVIIEGPRGSGKTMILKYISYRCQKESFLNKGRRSQEFSLLDLIKQDGSLGIYFRYKDNFGSLFRSLNCSQECKEKLFLYYYEMFVLEELFTVLSDIYLESIRKTEEGWDTVVESLNKFFGATCQHINDYTIWIHERIQSVDQWIRKSRYIENAESTLHQLITGENYIPETCRIIGTHISQLSKVRFLIIIDEYENASDYQPILNTLLKQVDHTANISYRIGVRPRGMKTLNTNIGTEFLQIDRDFLLYVLQANSMSKYKDFVKSIANRRLENIRFFAENNATDICKLLGTSENFDNEARSVVRNGSRKHFNILKSKIPEPEFDRVVTLLSNPNQPLMEMLNILWVLRGIEPSDVQVAMTAYQSNKGVNNLSPDVVKNAHKYKLDYSDKYRSQLLFALLGIYGQKKKYYSFNTFAYLSSGAVNDFISLCRNVFYLLDESYYENIAFESMIPVSIQAAGAEDTAIEQIEKIRLCNENGTEMHCFAMNMGSLFGFFHKDVQAKYPETNQFAFDDEVEIDKRPVLAEIKNNLIKWGVIIKKPRIQSISIGRRKGNLYYLNRIFCPIFGISYRTRGGYNFIMPTSLFETLLKKQEDAPKILALKNDIIKLKKESESEIRIAKKKAVLSDPNQTRFEV